MRPRIVLTLSRTDSPGRQRSRSRYIDAFERAGAEVLPVEPGDPRPEAFDALCLAGGEDVHPGRYREEDVGCEGIDLDRDAMEFDLLQRGLDAALPVLGICRGFQVLNVAFGGSLVQDLTGHRSVPPGDLIQHEIAPEAGSLLARVVGTRPHLINSSHHQGVTDAGLAPGLRPTVRVGGLVEAFESTVHRWVIGVQWHPERTEQVDAPATRIFTAFIEAAALTPAR